MTPTSPTLIVVSGPPGSGKTTLTREIAGQIGCPAIIRDEIKQGLVRATPGYQPGSDDPLNITALAAFFEVLGVLLKAGTTIVAEAAFQDRLWRPNLQPLIGLANIQIIRCIVPASTAHTRIADRAITDTHRAAHADAVSRTRRTMPPSRSLMTRTRPPRLMPATARATYEAKSDQ